MGIFRRIAQVVAFLVFLALVVHLAAVMDRLGGADLVPASYVRFSPLGAAATMLGGHAFILRYVPALVFLGLAVLFGRFFCGWICPLGSTIDFTDNRLAHARKGKKPTFYDGRRFKYYLMAFILVGAPLGISAAGWFDPLSIAVRSYGLAVVPYVAWLGNGLGLMLKDLPAGRLGEWWGRASQAALADRAAPVYRYHAVFLLLFAAILGAGLWYRRYWCRNLCPLGALLGLCSQKHLLKRSVSEACISCGKCERTCPMACITHDGKGTRAGECILCLRCQEACPVDAIRFLRRQPKGQDVALDLSKRGFLATMGATAVALPLLGLNVARRRTQGRLTALRPPGALPEDEFLARCVRCGECMRVCPTRGLQPAGFETGIEGLWTPTLVPRIGYCQYDCTLCGQTCPSQAIQKLALEAKHTRAIGKAKFDRSRCIPWRGHARFPEGIDDPEKWKCGTCEEACPVPTKAIRYTRFTARLGGKEIYIDRPYVVEDLCVGCGFCENVCPVAGEAAVRVEGPAAEARVAADETAVRLDQIVDLGPFFPGQIENWALKAPPKVYVGPKQLFEYIDGAGEPYLTYAFVQVAAGDYAQGRRAFHTDLWHFATPAEAFGAYSRDASAAASEPEKLANAAASSRGDAWCDLWAWQGPFYLHLASMGDETATLADARAVAAALVAGLPKAEPTLPPIVAALPAAGLVPFSVHYFHHSEMALPEALPTELVAGDALAITGKTPAAFARYAEGGKGIYDIVAVQYDSEVSAKAAFERCLALRATAKKAGEEGGVTVFELGEADYSAFVQRGTRVAGVLGAKSLDLAKQAAGQLGQSLAR